MLSTLVILCKCIKRNIRLYSAIAGLIPALLIPFEQVVWASEAIRTVAPAAQHSLQSTWQAYASPRTRFTSPLTHLPVLANGQSALTSNAFNFHGGSNAHVDSRTGTVSYTLTAASLLYRQTLAKRDLVLSYSSGIRARGPDTFGLGPHWNWNIGTEHPSPSEVNGHMTTDITPSDAHTLTMESDRNTEGQTIWHPLHHKLPDVIATGHPGNWTINTSTGMREHLLNGYEDWEQSRNGTRLYLYYNHQGPDDTTRALTWLCPHPLNLAEQQDPRACQGGIHITYQGRKVTVHGQQTITLNLEETDGITQVQSVNAPVLYSSGTGTQTAISFSYDEQGNRPWLLSGISTASGLSNTFLYNNESDHPGAPNNGLPTGINSAFIPVVTEQIISNRHALNTQVPNRYLYYRYGESSLNNQHDYLGYQGPASVEPGKDNLFDRVSNYTYRTTVDNGETSITTTYNKYHLPLTVEQYDDHTNTLLTRSEQIYPDWKQTTFAQLPPTYSMARTTIKTLHQDSSSNNTPVKIIQQKQYNNAGQIIWQKDVYGRITFTQYCPAGGDSHCPPMDPDWPQLGQPEKILVLPSQQQTLSSGETAPLSAMETVFDYQALPVKISEPPHLQATFLTKDHFSLVRRKTVGAIPPAALTGLKPGDPLPEPDNTFEQTRTDYTYNTDTTQYDYGQLTHLSVTRIPENPASVKKRFINLSAPTSITEGQNSITLNINHILDNAKGILTTSIEIKPQTQTKQQSLSSLMAHLKASETITLGTSVRSVKTGMVLSKTDPLKQMCTTWTYDSWNRPVTETVTPASGGLPQTIQWTYILTPQENAVVTTSPNEQQSKQVRSASGLLLSTWHRFANHSSLPMQGTSNWIPDSQMTYTSTNNIASKTLWHAGDPQGNKPGKAIALTTFMGYDQQNRPVWIQSPDGTTSFTIRDDQNIRLISYQVTSSHKETPGPFLTVQHSNILGHVTESYQFPTDPEAKKNGHPVYPPELQQQLKMLEAQIQPIATLQSKNSFGVLPLEGPSGLLYFITSAIRAKAWLTMSTRSYDGFARALRQVSGSGAATRWVYDNQNNMAAIITPDGSMIHDTVNVQGEKTSRCVQPKDGTRCHVLGTQQFNNDGSLKSQTDEYGQTVYYKYDDDGRLIKKITPSTATAPSGHVFTYYYNSLGKTEADLDGIPYVKYHYDPKTWHLTDCYDAVAHTHYTYDDNNNTLIEEVREPASQTNNDGILPQPGIHYPASKKIIIWDRYLSPVSFQDGEGNISTTTHDDSGRTLSTQVLFSGHNSATRLSTTLYDDDGRISTVTNGIGISRHIHYNAFGRPDIITDTQPNGAPLDVLHYQRDSDSGNLLVLTRQQGLFSATQTYTYDHAMNNLTSMTCSKTGKPATASPLCPRETELQNSGLNTPPIITSQQYTFDQWNNIKTVREQVVTTGDHPVTKIKNTLYQYATTGSRFAPEMYDPHRMLTYQSQWSGQRYSSTPAKITYDTQGRIIQDARGNKLHYNAFGQQNSFTNALTDETTCYIYNSAGHQIAEQPIGANNQSLQPPLYFFYQGSALAGEAQQDQHHKMRVAREWGGLARSIDGQIVSWYEHDYKGDVIGQFDSSGKQKALNVYSPYGMQYNLSDTQNQALPGALALASQHDWLLQSHIGFDNQRTDPATGYQFLGGGYRAYNPIYRHFMSRDSYSPFTRIDGYGFGANNPIMNTDPSGHFPRWLGYTLGVLAIPFAIATAFIAPVVMASAGASGAAIASAIVGTVSGVTGSVSGSLQIAATALPQNEKLQKSSLIFGVASGLLGIAMAGSTTVSAAGSWVNAIANGTNLVANVQSKLTNVLVIAGGIDGTMASLSDTANSAMGTAAAFNGRIARNKGLNSAMKIMGYVSMGLMASSLFIDATAGAINLPRLRKSRAIANAAVPHEYYISDEVQFMTNHSFNHARLQRLIDNGSAYGAALHGDVEAVTYRGFALRADARSQVEIFDTGFYERNARPLKKNARRYVTAYTGERGVSTTKSVGFAFEFNPNSNVYLVDLQTIGNAFDITTTLAERENVQEVNVAEGIPNHKVVGLIQRVNGNNYQLVLNPYYTSL